MSDAPDQRTELDDLLVVLRKVQRPQPDADSIKRAEAASKHIRDMIRKGVAFTAHHRIREQLEARLAELRHQPNPEQPG